MENNQSNNNQEILKNTLVSQETPPVVEKNNFDTKKFELEKELKKSTLSKEEYKKWLKEQINAQNKKCDQQRKTAKMVAVIAGVSFVFAAFLITILVVTLT